METAAQAGEDQCRPSSSLLSVEQMHRPPTVQLHISSLPDKRLFKKINTIYAQQKESVQLPGAFDFSSISSVPSIL